MAAKIQDTPTAQPAQDHRARYAKQFNTYPAYVRYWSEMTQRQQDQAKWAFSGTNMADHVYQVDTTGVVLSRRMLSCADDGSEGGPTFSTGPVWFSRCGCGRIWVEGEVCPDCVDLDFGEGESDG